MAPSKNPQHGDERNRSIYKESMGTYQVQVSGSTQTTTIPRGSYTATSVERYCGWCEKWAVTNNIIAWILHTECGHDWHDAPQ